MNTRTQTPEQLAMIALAEGRNAFANLRANHADLMIALKRILEASNRQMANGGDKLDYQDTNRQAGDIARSAIAKAEKLA
jgi:hypothetical protein